MINDNILSILCECNISFNENEFLKHFTSCTELFNKYKEFDSKISHLLRDNVKSKESLYIIKFLFKRYIEVLDDKLKKYYHEENININPNKIENINKGKNNDFNSINNKEELQLQKNKPYNSLKLKGEEKKLDDKNNPNNFIFIKKVSSQLYSKSIISHYLACIFTSIKDDNIYLAYKSSSRNLEYYDIANKKKKILFNQIFNKSISSCRYYLDKKNNRDLLIISSDKEVKIINFEKENSSVILDLNFQNRIGFISTSYIINNNILVPFIGDKKTIIEFYDFNNTFIKLEEENLGQVFSINTYFYEKKNLNYVIITYSEGIVVYDENFSNFKKLFTEGLDEKREINVTKDYYESYMINKNDSLVLVGSYSRYAPSYLCFWNFEKGNLLYSMKISYGISCIDLWNNDFIFISAAHSKSEFALININKKS